jgi:hypothetical protein
MNLKNICTLRFEYIQYFYSSPTQEFIVNCFKMNVGKKNPSLVIRRLLIFILNRDTKTYTLFTFHLGYVNKADSMICNLCPLLTNMVTDMPCHVSQMTPIVNNLKNVILNSLNSQINLNTTK